MKLPRSLQIGMVMLDSVNAILGSEKVLVKKSLAKLDDLGGVYIKFMQVLVLSIDMQSHELYKDLLSVYEHSKPDKINIHHYLSQKGFKFDAFLTIDDQPFATGSFGQIYKAQLRSGQHVIIKVLRPSIQKYLKQDLRIMKTLCVLFKIFDRQKIINITQVYSQFKKVTLDETNYEREAMAVDYYYQKYKNHSSLVIPQMYFQYSGPTVIVQDYIEGLSISRLLELKNNGVNPFELVQDHLQSNLEHQLHTIGFELLSKALLGDLLQADPHPGNILLLPNNKVALIDFGMLTEVRNNRVALYELLVQYQSYYSSELSMGEFTAAALKYLSPKLHSAIIEAEKLFDATIDPSTTLLEKLKIATDQSVKTDQTQSIVQEMLRKKMIMKVLFFVINKGNRFGLTLDMQSVAFLRAVQTYLNLCANFEANHNAPVVTQVINDTIVFAKQNLDKIISDTGSSENLEPLEALEILSNWFDKMSRKDPWLMNAIAGGYIK